ncbi:hypothetical protein QE250_05285 [Chromatiaceae bacterium AAb-1]|nr:hypothetical protein [Chromatiaceae bacterium AAb-1]
MSVIDSIKACFSSNSTASDKELLKALKKNEGQYIVKNNGAIALNLDNPETQLRLRREMEKYKGFLSSKE